MTLCSPWFLFRLFTPLWMVSMWISVNFRINPFMHEVKDFSICLRIYSIDAIMQSKRQNFIQTTRPILNKLARPPSWNDHSFSVDGLSCILIPLWRICCMTYKYWISWDDQTIFRVGVFRSMAIHCKILNMPWYFDRT
jgi:hypothetical protein